MRDLWKFAVFVVFTGALLWAQAGSGPTGQDNANSQATPPSRSGDKPTTETASKPNSEEPGPADSTKLETIYVEKAAYPWEAREKQLQGQVWVKILVSETGDVDNVELMSGDPVLAQAALDAAKRWKFKPFIRDGKPVPVSTKVPFNFAFSGNVRDEKEPKRVRVSQGVSKGLLIHKVQPNYPIEARQAHIQGTVVLRATISKEGRIVDLHLISGPEELAEAAIGAVQQWRYRPYMLLGEAVAVDTEIVVNFQLR